MRNVYDPRSKTGVWYFIGEGMTHKALYREWRPHTFKDVVEQEHITRTLKRAIMTDRISHAYLFSGTRGTGKTTLAKIFARAVNCLDIQDGDPCNKCDICMKSLNETLLDIVEIDAASNNSVDNIRKICDEVNYMPSLAKYKVYIIDEVHMLSASAFNALLKTLEEPPSHVIFILCTTEPNKLPATILSRCQRYDFHRITTKGIKERLIKIAAFEKEDITDDALDMISRVSFGAMRDAINLLDQCISSTDKKIDVDDVLLCAGLIDDEANAKVVQALSDDNVTDILSAVNDVIADGKSPARFLFGLLGYLRNILVCMNIEDPSAFIEADDRSIKKMKELCRLFEPDTVIRYIKELSENEAVLKRSTQSKTYLEIMLIGLLVKRPVCSEETKAPEAPVKAVVKTKPDENKVKPVPAEGKATEGWSAFIKKKIDTGVMDLFELLDSTMVMQSGQAVITVANSYLQDTLMANKAAVLLGIKEFDGNIKSISFLTASGQKAGNSLTDELRKTAEKHGIPIEIT